MLFENLQDKFKIKKLHNEYQNSIGNLQQMIEIRLREEEKERDKWIAVLLSIASGVGTWKLIYDGRKTLISNQIIIFDILSIVVFLTSFVISCYVFFIKAANQKRIKICFYYIKKLLKKLI